jgi:hypothetical protein
MSEEVPIKCRCFAVGETTSTGAIVKDIIASSDKCFIYIDQEDELGCEFEVTTCVDGDQSIREAMALYTQMKASHLPIPLCDRAKNLISAALSQALEDRHPGDSRDFFVDPREFLTTIRLEQFQTAYLVAAALTALVAILASLLPSLLGASTINEVFRAGAFGAVGALLSVLLRFKHIIVSRYASKQSLIVEGAVRVLLGSAFGVLFLMLQKGGLLMTIAAANIYTTSCVATVAGFSERLIPTLMQTLEGSINMISTPNSSAAPDAKRALRGRHR